MTHTMLGRFLLFSLLLHAGVFLFWRVGPLSGDLFMTTGAPLQLTLRSPVRDAAFQGEASPVMRDEPETAVMAAVIPDHGTTRIPESRVSEYDVSEPARASSRKRVDSLPAENGDGPVFLSGSEAPVEHESASVSPLVAGSPAAESAPLGEAEVRARLNDAVATHFYYPPLARRHGWEGEVLVDVRVEGDGRLSAIDVVSSSGYRVLDAAAVESLRRMARLSETAGLPEAGVVVTLPVRYMLIDGPA